MFLYLFSFIVFVSLYYLAEKSNKILFLWLAMIPPILFEGLRDVYVGKDMNGYGSLYFYGMNTNWGVKDVILNSPTPEYAYQLLIYCCKRIFNEIHLYMTSCAFIKISMVYLTAWKLRKQINSCAFLLAYFLFFYITGFSLMRQSIAIAICVFSLYFLLEKKIIGFSLLVITAYYFHNSAIFMLIWLIILLIRKWKSRYFLIFISAVILYFYISYILSFFVGSNIFKEGIAEHYMDSGVNTSKTMILLSISFILYGLFVLVKKRIGKTNSVFLFAFLSSSIYTLAFVALASYIEVAFRIAYYMLIVAMILSLIFIQQDYKNRLILLTLYIFLFLVDFYISVNHGLSGALDYSSKILGI